MKTVIEPFRIRTVEPLRQTTPQEREQYLAEAILEVHQRRDRIRGFEILSEPPFLRHFSARFRPAP